MDTKSILVTGGTGFLGSNLIRHFINQGYEVCAYYRKNSLFTRVSDIKNDVNWFLLEDSLEKPFLHYKLDMVIHCATNYGRKGEAPSSLIKSNILFPLELLEMASEHGVKTFINTDTVLARNTNPYSLSKAQFFDWAQVLFRDIQFINIKLEHMYGPNDDKSKFISYLLKQCTDNVQYIPLTEGIQKRDFIYIKDVVTAYSTIVDHLEIISKNEEFQIGTGRSVEIKEVANSIRQLTNSTTKLGFGEISYRQNELMDSVADISKLQVLSWSPKYDLINGLEETIANRGN